MNNFKFLLFFSLLLVMLSVKTVFFFQEPEYLSSLIGRADLIIVGILFILGVGFYLKDSLKEQVVSLPSPPSTWLPFFVKSILVILLLACLGLSFFISLSKQSLDWDDVALYDARAKFLQQGYRLSDMESLSQFDVKNSYYYLLYPPFTSELHFIWRGFHTGIEISALYSFMLILLALGIFLTTKPHLGAVGALAVSFLCVAQEHVFITSVLAYTNLPYTLYLGLGILLLYNYLESRKNWEFIFGILFVALSQWIRFLEPTWLAVLIGFSFVSFKLFSVKRFLSTSVLFAALCIFEYKNWQSFVKMSSDQEPIFNTSLLTFIEPGVGIFTGALVTMILFFCLSWGVPFLIHVSALLTKNHHQAPWTPSKELFLKLCIIFSCGMYFVGLYFISFQVEWWPEMGGSLVRSSTYLFPLSIYLLVREFKKHF